MTARYTTHIDQARSLTTQVPLFPPSTPGPVTEPSRHTLPRSPLPPESGHSLSLWSLGNYTNTSQRKQYRDAGIAWIRLCLAATGAQFLQRSQTSMLTTIQCKYRPILV